MFGARYSLGNQVLLMTRAEQWGITSQFFLPYGNRKRRTGWFRHDRHVREGETAFKIWAAVKRRPTEEQAQEWEAAPSRLGGYSGGAASAPGRRPQTLPVSSA